MKMSKHIYWCNSCHIPIIKHNTCPLCGNSCKEISSGGICNPVFLQEKRLLSIIWNKNVSSSDVWYLGSSQYLVDGQRVHLPYIEFMKFNDFQAASELLRKDISFEKIIPHQKEFISANSRYLNDLVFEAESYINDVIIQFKNGSQKKYVPTVSFSGGKDSTVVSRLVRDAIQSETIIHFFGDTTLEFPCTHDYIDAFRNENPYTPLIPSETENDFFRLCKVFGPPSRFERWCCTIFKTSNLNAEYQNLDGNSLTFLGIRRSESKERQRYERTQDHSKIGSQINAMPIIDWTDCDVWLYILAKKIDFNSAYCWGYKRVGCWCCPNNSNWSSLLTSIYYPQLTAKWKKVLYDFAEKTNKEDVKDYVENGKWKARRGASGLLARNATMTDTPCNLSDKARNIIVQKKLTRDVIEFFKPFGHLDIFDQDGETTISITEMAVYDENGVVYNKRRLCDLLIRWGTTVVKVLPEKSTDVNMLVNRLKCQLRKYQYCIRCTACDSVCPKGAICTTGDQRYAINENACPQNLQECSRCIAKFYNGCLTCQVLSKKKKLKEDVEDEV